MYISRTECQFSKHIAKKLQLCWAQGGWVACELGRVTCEVGCKNCSWQIWRVASKVGCKHGGFQA